MRSQQVVVTLQVRQRYLFWCFHAKVESSRPETLTHYSQSFAPRPFSKRKGTRHTAVRPELQPHCISHLRFSLRTIWKDLLLFFILTSTG
jgi:hypothetical protein